MHPRRQRHPRIDRGTLKYFPDLLEGGYLERRGGFYGASDPAHIPMHRLVDAYRGFAERNGFGLAWSFHLKRSDAGVHYLVLGIERARSSAGIGVTAPTS